MDWYARRVRSADRKVRAIVLEEEKGDRTLGKSGRSHFGQIRAIALWEEKVYRTSLNPKLL
ncbi:hypothetical protein QUA81_14095 [Microcoleus sp. F6_B4]